jgi:hypothetical protein
MNNRFSLCLSLLALAVTASAAPNAALLELQETAPAQTPAPTPAAEAVPPISSAQQLLTQTAEDLVVLYHRSEPGPIPDGAARGSGTVSPGTADGEASRQLIAFLWQGKIFKRSDDRSADLVNKTIFGETFAAKVYFGKSMLDEKESIIIDYSETPFKPFRIIRDEIRLVAPGVYLGYAYLRGLDVAPVIFALDFNAPKSE